MSRLDRDDWRDLPSAVTQMYWDVDAESARIRAAHLNAVVRLTPSTMLVNIGNALLIVWAFSPGVPPGMWVWLGVLVSYCGLALVNWRMRGDRLREMASPRALHRATTHAIFLAGLWGVMPVVWFPDATVGQQMTVATLITGMIGAGSFVLSPLPMASLAYIAVFSLSALWTLWRAGNPALLGVAVLVGLYSFMVAIGSLAAWRKATALIRSQAKSARQEKLLAVLLQDFEQQAGEALWEIGVDGCLKHQSPRLIDLMGPTSRDDLERPFLQLVQRQSPAGAERLREVLDAGRPFRDLRLPWGEGSQERHLSISGKRVIDETGQKTLGWRGVLADVSEKVSSERLLLQLAHTDSLTGLSNRFVLRDVLAQALRQKRKVALLSIDLDHFKSVNDSHGHSAGDELLKAVSKRLQACVRPGDLVARLGGDEFAVLLLDPTTAAESARLAERVIDRLSEPIDTGGRRLRVGASAGVALCDGNDIGVDDMLVQADMALYAAKGAGRGRHLVYAPELGVLSHRRLAVEEGLRQAVKRGELSLHWQAKVDIATWRVTGAEALMRWTHPELGRVSPVEFIVVAEQCGLIDELGRWALNEACQAAVVSMDGLPVSVNVSPMQLRDENFIDHVRQALRQSGLAPARLELEITESVFIDDADGALEKLHALRSLGLRVALDDFGTGYSSLSYLRRFPFDTLKIDRSFVNEILLRKDARAIVEMIANLATTLGICTVCEGVETVEQLRAVSDAGCDQAQGYLISEPRPLAELHQLQLKWSKEPPHALH